MRSRWIVKMYKDFNVLLVDDQAAFSKSSQRLLEDKGIHCETATSYESALKKFQAAPHDFQLVLIDCVLPGQDGLTLSENLLDLADNYSSNTKVFLMSGILNKDALNASATLKSRVLAFIPKENFKEAFFEEVNKIFPEKICEKKQDSASLLVSLSTDLEQTLLYLRQRSLPTYQLFYFLPLLSHLEFSGKLELVLEDQNFYRIEFKSGAPTSIQSSSYTSSLGETLVGLGYLKEDYLSSYLESPEFKNENNPIGQGLVKKNLVSPHAIDLSLKVQIENRISEIFSSKEVTIKVLDKANIESKSLLSSSALIENINDIIYKTKDPDFNRFIEELLPYDVLDLNLSTTNGSIYTYSEQKVKDLFKARSLEKNLLLILFNKNIVTLQSKGQESLNRERVLQELQDLHINLSHKSPYTVFGINKNDATDQKISKIYHSIAKKYHPDKVGKVLKGEDLEFAQNTFALLTKSFNSIKTEENRKTYESLQANKASQEVAENNKIIQSVKRQLFSEMYEEAYKQLNTKKMKLNPPEDFPLYFAWTCIKLGIPQIKSYIDANYDKIGASSDPLLSEYVLCLIDGLRGNREARLKGLRDLLDQNPGFLPARREFKRTKTPVSENTNAFFRFKKTS